MTLLRRKLAILLAATVALFLVSAPIFAHHGTAAYDLEKSVTLKGTVTQFEFINPHVILSFDVKNDQGKVENWQSEATGPQQLRKMGLNRESLKENDQITITGNPARNGSHTMRVLKLVMPDGQELKIASGAN
jgi:hypothetical protein